MIERTLRYLPVGLRGKIQNRQGLIKILNNISWLFLDKFLRMGVGLFVGVWIARYLGPEQFGILNYALAFVAMFTVVSTLGLHETVVHDLVHEPSATDTTMGSVFALQTLGGFCGVGLAMLAIDFVRPDDDITKLAVALLSMLMVFRASEVVRYWFESQIQSKYVVWTENTVFLIFAAAKILLILTDAPLIAFIWALFFEGFLISIGLLGIYTLRGKKICAWRVRYNRVQILIKNSWPLILSNIAIMIYMRIDQIMLGQMMGDKSVGIYTAAVKISEVWYFIPVTITASVFPSLIEAKKISEIKYHQQLQQLYMTMLLLALAVAIPMTFLSDWLVSLLYGTLYKQAGIVLSIHIWAGIFVFLWVASGKWFLMEGLQKYTFYRNILGAIINVVLNLLLIPKYAVVGSAWATVASIAFASVFFNLLSRKTRPLFFMQLKSCLAICRFLNHV